MGFEDVIDFARDAIAFRDASSAAVEGMPLSVACVAPLKLLSMPEYRAGVMLHPWVLTLLLLTVGSTAMFLLSTAFGDYSMVDRIWSILPPVAVMLFAFSAGKGAGSVRLWIMSALTAFWGIRLTYNFFRKGGYKIHVGEDYRWAYLQQEWFGGRPEAWIVFNLMFVSVYQTALLLAFSAVPAYEAALNVSTPLGPADAVLAVLFLALFAGETIADEQMWAFQTEKRNAEQSYSGKGFFDGGLFYYSRHPNYFCEVGMWVVFSFFGPVSSGNGLVTFSQLGSFLLATLFIGSTWITEKISSQKYPEYAEYQRTTSAFIPFFKLDKLKFN